jgi:hypothetical protein
MAVIKDGVNASQILGVDPISKAAKVTLYKTDGTLFPGFIESSQVTSAIVASASPALSTTYTQGTSTRLGVDGYNTVTYIVNVLGSAGAHSSLLVQIWGSLDNSTWLPTYLFECFVLAPQGATAQGVIQFQSQFPYLRVTALTDGLVAPASFSIDQIVGHTFSTGADGESVNTYGSIIEGDHGVRGLYSIHFSGLANTTAGYSYLSIWNPANSLTHVRIDEIKLGTYFIAAAAVTTRRTIDLTTFTTTNAGTAITPQKLKRTYPAAGCSSATGATLTGVATPSLTSFVCSNSSAASPAIRDIKFPSDKAIILDPGVGLTFYAPTALTVSDSLAITVGISEIA